MKKKIFSVESLKLIQVKQRKDEYMVQLSASQITTGKDNPGTEPIRIHSCCHFTPGRTFRSPDPVGYSMEYAGKSPYHAGKHGKSLEHGSSIPVKN
ncbi:unnamed protein product, partial [Rotaria magnacalcarata]